MRVLCVDEGTLHLVETGRLYLDSVLLPYPVDSVKLVVQGRHVFLALCDVLLDLCLVGLEQLLILSHLVLQEALYLHLCALHLDDDPKNVF